MIINDTYFVGELHLSQVGASASTKVNNNTKFQYLVDEYEVELMEFALGKILSKEFFEQFESNGSLKAAADVRWSNLLNGETFTQDGCTYHWQGLRNERGSLKRSLIAYYVYCKYLESEKEQISTMGVVKPLSENAKIASILPKYTRAWRKLLEWYGDCDYLYFPRITVKRRGTIYDYSSSGSDYSDLSLYNYLSLKKDIFSNWHFTGLVNKNQFQL